LLVSILSQAIRQEYRIMLLSHLTIAIRSILKNKLFSCINIGGLTVGLAIFLFTDILANYERNYDTFFDKSEQIHVSVSHFKPGGPVGVPSAPAVPSATAARLREIPGVERAVRSFDRPFVAQVGDSKFYQNIRFFDDGLLDIFEFDFISGDPATVLQAPTSLIISDKVAEKLFGSEDPLNRIITLDGKHDMQVSGVYRSLPGNSHFTNSYISDNPFDMGGSVEALAQLTDFDTAGDWQSISANDVTYVLLAAGVTPESLEPALDQLLATHFPNDMTQLLSAIRLDHVSHLNTYLEDAIGIPIYAVIQVIGVLILLVAILNYTNLATAQAVGRALEVGIRKTMGANRARLFMQFIVEAVTLTMIAAGLAVAILQVVLPILNDALNRNASSAVFSDPGIALFVISVVLATGLISGSYPAVVLARMQVVTVLSGGTRFGTHRLRNAMLGVQFTFAVLLTTMVFVINAQNDKVNETARIFDQEHIVNLLQIRPDMRPSYDTLVNELRAIPGVQHVSGASMVPFEARQSLREMTTARTSEDKIITNVYQVDEDFMAVFEVPQVAGRGLLRAQGDLVAEWETEEDAPTAVNILINELAVSEFGWASPQEAVGKVLYQISTDPGPGAYTIVGVVENRDFIGIFGGLKASMFVLRPGTFTTVSMRIAEENTDATVAAIETVWNRIYPAYPVTRNFLDDQFNNSFELFELIGQALAGLAIMATFLAGLGLFGLAAFLAETRTREIGLRKVMGADIPVIVRLLLWQFSKPVAVAVAIGTPLAVLASQQYLNFFAQRVALGPVVFLVSATLIMGFAWVTVATHAIRVARVNPITSLRYK
jgi:putative ABC transport system permease protein